MVVTLGICPSQTSRRAVFVGMCASFGYGGDSHLARRNVKYKSLFFALLLLFALSLGRDPTCLITFRSMLERLTIVWGTAWRGESLLCPIVAAIQL